MPTDPTLEGLPPTEPDKCPACRHSWHGLRCGTTSAQYELPEPCPCPTSFGVTCPLT
jgi:hypothetical protein